MLMRISLIISFLVHLTLILAFRNAFPFNWNDTQLRTYQVELLRPPTDGIKPEELAKAELSQLNKDAEPEKTENEETEDTISLDTKDKRYLTYTILIKERIMHNWHYPPEAKENLMEGKAQVLFSLGKSGELLDIKIIDSSGYEILDQEGLRAIRATAPFPPFPDQISVSKLHVKASLDYHLNIK
jgi:protein TonB